MRVRPAAPGDAARAWAGADLLADRWAAGGGRRSLVAEDEGGRGRVLGHCRGVDNPFHPGSRTLVLGVDPALDDAAARRVADALVAAQAAVSSRPLRLRITEEDRLLRRAAAVAGGVVEQVLPPWRLRVGPALRSWAARWDAHDGYGGARRPRAVERGDAAAVVHLWAGHYAAQHARWAPAAPAEELAGLFSEDLAWGAPGCYEPARSRVRMRGGRAAAAALVWPAENDGAREVTVMALPREGAQALADAARCLARVVDGAEDGQTLLVDTHLTEPCERRLMGPLHRHLASCGEPAAGGWTLLVALPVAGGITRPFAVGLLEGWDAPAWVRGALAGAGGC